MSEALRPASTGAIELFLDGARVALQAIADPAVAAGWTAPSVLPGMSIGALAAHLARGGVWVFGEYLAGDEPAGPPTFADAGSYFAALATHGRDQVLARSVSLAEVGAAAVADDAATKFAAMEPLVRSSDPRRLVSVIAGATIPLEAYAVTRVVEQAVHLSDLAASLGRAPWTLDD